MQRTKTLPSTGGVEQDGADVRLVLSHFCFYLAPGFVRVMRVDRPFDRCRFPTQSLPPARRLWVVMKTCLSLQWSVFGLLLTFASSLIHLSSTITPEADLHISASIFRLLFAHARSASSFLF